MSFLINKGISRSTKIEIPLFLFKPLYYNKPIFQYWPISCQKRKKLYTFKFDNGVGVGYTINMIKNIIKFIRKSFWLPPEQGEQIEQEAKKNFHNNQSELMRHIISNWFKK